MSLAENPASASEAHFLAEAIQEALKGSYELLSNYGTIAWRLLEEQSGRPWNAACFYDQDLAEAYEQLLKNPALSPLGIVADVEPAGQAIRGAFMYAEKRQSPDRQALWDHKSARQTSMQTGPDKFLVAREEKQNYAASLWKKRGNLLLANRMRLNKAQTPAVFSDKAVLGSAFVPVTPKLATEAGKQQVCKAWCVWLNTTLGFLAFLNNRQKQLTYPHFSLEGLRALPVPNPQDCDIKALAQTYDRLAKDPLQPLPSLQKDKVRMKLDVAVSKAVPGLPDSHTVAHWREAIALEPSVNNLKEQPGPGEE